MLKRPIKKAIEITHALEHTDIEVIMKMQMLIKLE